MKSIIGKFKHAYSRPFMPLAAKPVCGRTGPEDLALDQPGGVARECDFFFYTPLVYDHIL